MSALLPLEILIGDLKEIAHCPRAEFLKIAHHIEGLPRVTVSEAGPEAFSIAVIARNFACQMRHVRDESEQEMRGIAQALAVVLQNELNAADEQRRPRRHWVDG